MSQHEIWNELGNLYFITGELDQALDAYTKATKINEDFGQSYSNLALVYARKGLYQQAIDLFQKSINLLENDKEKAIAWSRLGDLFRQIKEYDKAINAYQMADHLEIQSIECQHDNMSEDEVYWGTDGESSNIDTELACENSTDSEILNQPHQHSEVEPIHDEETYSLKSLEFDNNLTDETKPELFPMSDSDISSDSSNLDEPSSSHSELSMAVPNERIAKNSIDRADSSTMWTGENPRNSCVSLPTHADKLVAENQALNSLISTEDSLTVSDPGSSENDPLHNFTQPAEDYSPTEAHRKETAYINPITARNQIRNHFPVESFKEGFPDVEKEIARYTKTLQINPCNALAWDTLGSLYKSAGQYKEAIMAFQEALSIDSSKAAIYHHLGLVYAVEGMDNDAIEAFKKVLELEPDHVLAHASLGGYYRKMGLEDLALQHIARARKGFTNCDESEYNQACLNAICGDVDRAIGLLRIAMEKKQTYPEWIRRDPDLDFIRSDPRFQSMYRDFTWPDQS